MTRKIIDSNYVQSPALTEYFEDSSENYAVIIDYLAMEAYKGNTQKSIFRSMEVLCRHPKQVIILKSTLLICGLSGSAGGLQRRMIDRDQTRDFGKYCRALTAAQAGNQGVLQQLSEFGSVATTHMDRVRSDVADLIPTFKAMATAYTSQELHRLRREHPFTEDMIKKMIQHTLLLSRNLFTRHPKVERIPRIGELRNTYIFRFSLCAYVLFLRWISTGGQTHIKIEKIHNDMVDLSFAAYATFFGGLLSADAKLMEIHSRARFLLDEIFTPLQHRKLKEIASRRSQ